MKETPASKDFNYKYVSICSSPVLLQRSLSLRQKKKILPGDKISVEKNFPKFYEKCQIKKQRSVTCSKSSPDSGTIKTNTCGKNKISKQNVMKEGSDDLNETAELQVISDQIQSLKIEKNSLLSVKSRSQKADTTPKVVYAHKKSPVPCKRSRHQLTEEFAEEFEKQQRRKQKNASSAEPKLNLFCCGCQDQQLKFCCCEESQQINNCCEQKQLLESESRNSQESLFVPTTKVGAVQSNFKPKGLKDKTKDGKDDGQRHLGVKEEKKVSKERKAEERFNQACKAIIKTDVKTAGFEESNKRMRQGKYIIENGHLDNVSESKSNDREQQNTNCSSKIAEQPRKENSMDDKDEVFIEGSIQQPNEIQESRKVVAITRKVSQQALLQRISEEEEQKDETGIGKTLELRRPKKLEYPNSLPLAKAPTINKYAIWKKVSEEMKNREIANGCSSVTEKSELDKLKLVTEKLHLNTRRPSYVEWLTKLNQGKIFDGNSELKAEIVGEKQTEDERRENLKNALKWLRNELLEMNRTDQRLARQLMQLRIEIQTLRLQMSCSEHQAMVEEVTSEVEDLKDQDMPLCDFPMGHRGSRSPLRDIGITRMNITNRRFSLS